LDLHPVVNALQIYLVWQQQKRKCVSRKENKNKKKKKKVKKSNPFEGTPFLKAKQHCTFWYPKTENCAVPISIQA
jgi:hypothetical protein